jgi:hypothetical protein
VDNEKEEEVDDEENEVVNDDEKDEEVDDDEKEEDVDGYEKVEEVESVMSGVSDDAFSFFVDGLVLRLEVGISNLIYDPK